MDNIKYDKIAAWKVVYNNLKKVLPDHAIHAWFDPIKPISFNSEVMVLGVPSQFFLEWIDSHYSDHIQSVLNNIYNSGIQYRFIVQKSQPEIIKNESIEKETPKKSTSRFNNLNSKYTFDKFIVGDNNEFAKTELEEKKIKPAGQPKLDLKTYGEDKDLEYVLSVIELPKVEIKSLENIKFDEYTVKIDESETDKRIKEI